MQAQCSGGGFRKYSSLQKNLLHYYIQARGLWCKGSYATGVIGRLVPVCLFSYDHSACVAVIVYIPQVLYPLNIVEEGPYNVYIYVYVSNKEWTVTCQLLNKVSVVSKPRL